MASTPEAFEIVRQIQGWSVLLSCLPADGKAREFFALALSVDEGPWLERINPLGDPDGDEGLRAWLDRIRPVCDPDSDEQLKKWLEYLWIRGNLSPEDQELVDWQADPENMNAAVAEYLAVLGRVRSA
jgi:hypothetical protein